MMIRNLLLALGLYIFYYSICTAESTHYGMSLSYPIIANRPASMHGYRGSLWYQPSCLVWNHDNSYLYFDASLGHYQLSNHSLTNRNITIFAIAPILRVFITKQAYVSPYVEVSIGPAYLSSTYLDTHNLGMHLAFQDQVILGAAFGEQQRLTASVGVVHYSNAELSSNNAGITIPLMLNISYSFA